MQWGTNIQASSQKPGLQREIVHANMISLFGEQGAYLFSTSHCLSKSLINILSSLLSPWAVFYILIYLPDPGLARSSGNTSKFFWTAWTHTLSLTQSWWWTMPVPTILKACVRSLKSGELCDSSFLCYSVSPSEECSFSPSHPTLQISTQLKKVSWQWRLGSGGTRTMFWGNCLVIQHVTPMQCYGRLSSPQWLLRISQVGIEKQDI